MKTWLRLNLIGVAALVCCVSWHDARAGQTAYLAGQADFLFFASDEEVYAPWVLTTDISNSSTNQVWSRLGAPLASITVNGQTVPAFPSLNPSLDFAVSSS